MNSVLNQAGIPAYFTEDDMSDPGRMIEKIFENVGDIRSQLRCRLVNTKKQERYRNIPYRKVADLSLLCTVALSEDSESMTTLFVTEPIMRRFGLKKNEMFDLAMKNTGLQLPPMICSMSEMLGSLGTGSVFEPADKLMLIVSNTKKIFGAVSILCTGVDKMLREKLGDYYILPSSVHEVIAVSKKDGGDPYELAEMVRIINMETVDPKEVLSDNVYEIRNGKLKIANTTRAEVTEQFEEQNMAV